MAVTIVLLCLLTNHLRQQWQTAGIEGDCFCHLLDTVILNLSLFDLLCKSDAAAIT